MLTSLLSLYIASVLQTDIIPVRQVSSQTVTSVVKTASFDSSKLEEGESFPIKKPEFISPIIQAKEALAMDLNTGAILFEQNIHERRQIASLTKLMTALIIMEENDLNETVTVSSLADAATGSIMYLRKGEQIEVKNLIYGMIIHSANDAAKALAEHNAGSEKAFVEKMNKKALALGLLNTHFSNAVGLDDKNNYSSAYDLAKLSEYVYQKNFIKEAALIKELKVKSKDGGITHDLKSTNDLLDTEFIKFKGLKTGTTDSAGLCVITVAEDKNGHEILTVLLGSPDRFKETKILAEWAYRAYSWEK